MMMMIIMMSWTFQYTAIVEPLSLSLSLSISLSPSLSRSRSITLTPLLLCLCLSCFGGSFSLSFSPSLSVSRPPPPTVSPSIPPPPPLCLCLLTKSRAFMCQPLWTNQAVNPLLCLPCDRVVSVSNLNLGRYSSFLPLLISPIPLLWTQCLVPSCAPGVQTRNSSSYLDVGLLAIFARISPKL